jgi:hypothetical protein
LIDNTGQKLAYVFDLDQIQGHRAQTIVNNGLAFCETGVE